MTITIVMSRTVLVVDDEDELNSIIREYLESQDYKALSAKNVGEALNLAGSNKIDLVISDIQMPGKTGIEFFKDFKQNIDKENKIPFVLMTGFADVLSVQNAFAMGVNELIAKPFDLEAVGLVVDYLLGKETAYGSTNEKFFSVPISEIILSKTSDYTLYLKVIDKYVRVTKSGQEFTAQRLENFARKGASHVYLTTSDFAKYTDLQFAIASTVGKRPIEEVKKMKIMNQLMSSISQSSVAVQLDKKYLNQSIQAFEAYTQVALTHSQLNNIMSVITSDSPDLTDQSTLRAILSSSVANLWKWNSPKVQSRVILSALLADIGLKDHQHLLKKKKFEYTQEENKIFEQHPLVSHEILRQIEGIPEEILHVAIQHHENAAGLGFPQRLPRSKIHAFSKLVHGVNVFIEAVMAQDDRQNVKKVLDLIHKIQGKTVSEQVVKSLYIIFGLEVPQPLEGTLLPDETSRVV